MKARDFIYPLLNGDRDIGVVMMVMMWRRMIKCTDVGSQTIGMNNGLRHYFSSIAVFMQWH